MRRTAARTSSMSGRGGRWSTPRPYPGGVDGPRPRLLDRLSARGSARSRSAARLIGVDLVASGLRKAHTTSPRRCSAGGCVFAAARRRERGRGRQRQPARARVRRRAGAARDPPRPAARRARGDRRSGSAPAPTTTTIASSDTSAATPAASWPARPRRRADRVDDVHLGALLYPGLLAVKQRNRRRYDHLAGRRWSARCRATSPSTRDSRAGRLACASGESACSTTACGCRSASAADRLARPEERS